MFISIMEPENAVNKRPNRKRKKSVLKNARKYAKKGYYGRGSHIDADTYQYFVRIMETYREGFETDEDKLNFVQNVFEQTENQEVTCCCNQVGCRVVEMLLPFANDAVFERFTNAFGEDMRPLCSDRFATHVLEELVTQSTKRSLDQSNSETVRDKYKQFVLKVSKFLLNNLEDYIWDTYANHVIRTCLHNLAQIPKIDPKVKPNHSKPPIKEELDDGATIPEYYSEIVKDYAERLIVWPQFQALCESEITSGFLQILLQALKKVDKKLLKRYLEKLQTEVFVNKSPDSLAAVFQEKAKMMLLETCLQIAKSKQFTALWEQCFKGQLPKLAKTRTTNFSVQKLLAHCQNKEEFESIFDELSDHFDDIFNAGHSGVILAVAEACKRLSAKQGQFVQSLMKAMQCLEPEERQNWFIICLSRMTPYDTAKTLKNDNLHKDKLNLHGTLLVQHMLEFNKPIKLVNALLNMETEDVKNLFSNSMGSHIVDSYVKSAFVGEKSREKLVRKMKGQWQELAATKYGSRSFEALYNAANLKAKLSIMDELSYKDASWSNTEHGKIIAGKVNLVLYKRNKEDWKNGLNKTKVEDLFADIVK